MAMVASRPTTDLQGGRQHLWLTLQSGHSRGKRLRPVLPHKRHLHLLYPQLRVGLIVKDALKSHSS